MKIEIQDIHYSYSNTNKTSVNIFNGFSLNIEEGEFAVFLGPSGCGKSTLLRIITGLLKPNKGVVLIDGLQKEIINNKTGIVFQSYTSYPWLTVSGNIAFGVTTQGF